MSSPTPVALPSDFMNQWAHVEPYQDLGRNVAKSALNPFSDVNESSRMTASGFTDTTFGNERASSVIMMRAQDALEESVKMSEKLSKKTGAGSKMNKKDLRNRNFEFDRMSADLHDMTEPMMSGARGSEQRMGRVDSPRDGGFGDDWVTDQPNQYVTMADFTKFAETISKTMSIHPNDSASNVGRNNLVSKSFEPLNIKKAGTTMTPILESSDDVEETVVGGYTMSPYEKMIEVDSHSKISPVKGLPVIFTNSRLNFLTHVHSPLFKLLRDSEGSYPSVNCLEILLDSRKDWGDEPSTLLLEAVLDSTIDQKSGVVKANPFNIPVIEPTMALNSRIMYMALDQLHREFEIEWFNTMKFVTLPIFQSKYDSMRFTGVKRRERRASKSSSGDSKSTTSSSRVSNSRRGSRSDDNGSILGRFLS
jgi:hypothetical protein